MTDPHHYWLIVHGATGRCVAIKEGVAAAYQAARDAVNKGQIVEVRDANQQPITLEQLAEIARITML